MINVSDRETLTADDATRLCGYSKVQISRWRVALADRAAFEAAIGDAAKKKALIKKGAGELVQQSVSNEHYTPAQYIEAARKVLGAIDLDPASCAEANKVVKAHDFFTEEMDGLSREWHGNVWLNPPYGRLAGAFVEKLAHEFATANTTAAIVLVNAHCTDTSWFQPLWDGALCFTDHRINFYGDDSRSGSTHGSVFVYFGDRISDFVKHFSEFGPVLRRVG